MSVNTPIVDSWDGPNRRIYLKAGVSDIFPMEDLYHEYRNARRLDEDFRKYEPLMRAEGNIPKGGGAFTPRYVVLLLGTKVIPFDEDTRINQLGDMITDDPDTDSDLYDLTGFVNPIRVFIQPSESEIIQLNSAAIEYSSYSGGVSYDETSPYSGTLYPNGTPQQPVNSVYDAQDIAIDRGFTTIFILSDLDVPADVTMQGATLIGAGKDRTTITIPDAANVSKMTYLDSTVTGYLDGNNTLKDCLVSNLNYIKGYIEGCVLSPGTITLSGTEVAHFLDCYSGQPGTGTPIIDMANSGQALALRNYNGGIKLINKTGTEDVSIDLNSGQVILDNTVTGGTIVVRGVGKLIDTNGDHIHSGTWNGVTIVNEAVTPDSIAKANWAELVIDNQDPGTLGELVGKKLLTLAKYLGLK